MKRHPAHILVILTMLLPASFAWGEPGTVLVVPLRVDGAVEIDEVLPTIEAEIAADPDLTLMQPASATLALEKRLITPDPSFDVVAWNAGVEQGITHFIYTRTLESITVLEAALQPIVDDPSLLYLQPGMAMAQRTWEGGLTLVRALLFEAQALRARRWMDQLVRLFPFNAIDTTQFPPEVVGLHAQARAAAAANASTLSVEVIGDDSCTITLNGMVVAQGHTFEKPLPSTVHFVRAECAADRSLVRRADLQEGVTSIVIAPSVEAALALAPRLTLTAGDLAAPQSLAPAAGVLASLTGAQQVVFVGAGSFDDSQWLQVSLFEQPDGHHLGSARLPLALANEREQVARLLTAAAQGTGAPGILVFDGAAFRSAEGAGPAADEEARLWTWVAVGVGGAALGSGIILGVVGRSEAESAHDAVAGRGSDTADSMLLASDIMLVGGIACLVFALVLYVVEAPSEEEAPAESAEWRVGAVGLDDGGMLRLEVVF